MTLHEHVPGAIGSDRPLAGRTAIVTGASAGIGREIARALGAAGASVGLLARRGGELARTAEMVDGAGAVAAWATCDVTDPAAISAAVETIAERLGTVDILVNNAGGARFAAPLLDVKPQGWSKVIDLNLTAPLLMAQAVVPGMIAVGRGVVVNVGSLVAIRSQQSLGPYASAKAGLTMLTRTMAREWGPFGVRANAVVPGLVATAAWDNYRDDPDLESLTGGDPPLQRWAEPGEVAAPVVFLASEAASYITGAAVVVDGGATA